MRKTSAMLTVCLLAMFMFAGMASAHVTVLPKQTTQGAYEKFTVRVPSETANTNTIKVEVKFPEGVTISRVEPKPDWTHELSKDSTGKITGVIFTATGEGLAVTEFTEFNLSGRVETDAKSLTWKAYQTYKNGTVAEWVGADGADKPASVTTVKAATGATDSHGHDTGSLDHGEHEDSESSMPLILSIIAVVLGALSLIVSLTRKAK